MPEKSEVYHNLIVKEISLRKRSLKEELNEQRETEGYRQRLKYTEYKNQVCLFERQANKQ